MISHIHLYCMQIVTKFMDRQAKNKNSSPVQNLEISYLWFE
jgi:hypothetical protein